MLRRISIALLISLLALLTFSFAPVLAQTPTPTERPPIPLEVFTDYPSQVIGLGETVTFPLKIRTETNSQVVTLSAQGLPDGWTVTFRGGGNIVNSVYAEIYNDASVDMQVEPPTDVAAGDYKFTLKAQGQGASASLDIAITIQEKLPPKLTLTSDLPTLRGTPSTNFSFNVTLKNEGDSDLSVNLSADSPSVFLTSFTLSGQDVTDVPLGPRESKRLSISAKPVGDVPAGTYDIKFVAQGGEAQAEIDLTAEVTGQADITITTSDGRLSGQAYAGRDTPLKIVVQNNGTAPARGVTLSSTESSGWTVSFDPKEINEIPAGQQVEVTTSIRPADKAVAGDYMITLRAQTADNLSKSTDFRITVRTSTLWGVVGIVLIAIAVGVVALAVMRFGRR
jgi:uncharacterized membrane protein